MPPGIVSTSPLQLESYENRFDTVTGINLNSVASSDVTNFSGIGVLNSIAFIIPSGSFSVLSVQLDITIDGGTIRSFPLVVAGARVERFKEPTDEVTSPGKARWVIPIVNRFSTSCKVSVNVTQANGSAMSGECTVVRGAKL